MALSGLRVIEVVKSLERISQHGLEGYVKDGILEHFRFKDEFLRGNKNAYVTVATHNLLSVLKEWDNHVSYSMLVKRCKKYGLKRRFHPLRKFYATTLRLNGVPTELVNLLQGRIGSSIFLNVLDHCI